MKETSPNKPRLWKRIGIASGIVLGVCSFCFFLAMMIDNLIFAGLCVNQISQEVLSPDNTYKVIVFQRDCGATTGFSTQVSILKNSSQLGNHGGNIFVMDGHPDWTQIGVNWDGDRSVTIEYPIGYRVFVERSSLRDFLNVFEIQYQVK